MSILTAESRASKAQHRSTTSRPDFPDSSCTDWLLERCTICGMDVYVLRRSDGRCRDVARTWHPCKAVSGT